jgi:hypothetical protein
MKKITISNYFVAFTIAMSISANAQNTTGEVQQRLVSLYPLTKTTSDKTDIVTAGAVVTLQKDNLKMVPIDSRDLFQNTYQQGRITQNRLGKIADADKLARKFCGRFGLPACPDAPAEAQSRVFVVGEKMWVTGINVNGSGVVFDLFTDAYDNVRYKASLAFPINGHQAEQLVAEVFAAGNPADNTSQLPPIEPPPPPDIPSNPEPKRISLGQTTDQIVAVLGQPVTIAKPSADKEIYFYRNFKVTFANRRVVDAE